MDDILYSTFFAVEDRHWWFAARRKIVFSLIKAFTRVPRGADILDVGCGTGAFLKALTQDYSAFGIDLSPLAIEQCHARGLSRVAVGTLDGFPFPNKHFHLVTMLDVIEHIDDDLAALRLAKGLLTNNGYLFLTVPAFPFLWSKHDEMNRHKRRYKKKELKTRLEQSGYTIDFISYYNTFLFPIALIERLFEKSLHLTPSSALRIPPAPLNAIFTCVFGCERWFLRKVPFPFGLSLLAIAHPK